MRPSRPRRGTDRRGRAGVHRAALPHGGRTGRGAPSRGRADRRRREHPQGRRPAGRGAGRGRRHRRAEGRPCSAGRRPSRHRRPHRHPGGDLQRAGLRGRHRRRTGRRGRPTAPGHACGLGTGGLFVSDVADLVPVDGSLPVGEVVPDPARLADLAASPQRRDWWIDRVRQCYPLA